MRYTIKAGMLYEENRREPLVHMKGVFSGPEKHICPSGEEGVLHTDIRNLPVPPGKRTDVRFREYVMLDPDANAVLINGIRSVLLTAAGEQLLLSAQEITASYQGLR